MKDYECSFARGPYTCVQTRHGNRDSLDLISRLFLFLKDPFFPDY